MTAKEELHELVDQLGNDGVSEALGYLRALVESDEQQLKSAMDRLNRRMGPGIVSGREFVSTYQQPKDFATLAAEQGVKPVEKFEDLLGDFWPEDEKGEEFDEWLRRVRRDDHYE